MKKKVQLLMLILFLLLLAGCRKQEETVGPPVQVAEEPFVIETLRVEISKNGLGTQSLMTAVKELPGLLEEYFADTDVEIGSVKVTVGAAPADTAKALAEGRIDVGFLPTEGYLSYGGQANVLFADEGTTVQIYAVPTEYGNQLLARSDSKVGLSWTELANARWGILEGTHDCLDLWLAEEYDGRADALPNVTVYESSETLAGAAVAGEIDVLGCGDDLQEMDLLGRTGTLYSQLAVAAPELTDERFTEALETVLTRMQEKEPEQMALFGTSHFTAVTDEALDPTRRLLAMEQETAAE